jgi:hypothetical protein
MPITKHEKKSSMILRPRVGDYDRLATYFTHLSIHIKPTLASTLSTKSLL